MRSSIFHSSEIVYRYPTSRRVLTAERSVAWIRAHAIFAAVLLIVTGPGTSTRLTGQSFTTGDVVGFVTDASGAVIIKTTVTLRNNEKGFSQAVTTNAQGLYRFPFLSPGRYTVTITVPGFEAASRTVAVSVGQTASVDLTLKVGSANTTVAVTTDAPMLQTENADGSTVFNAAQIANLPNPGNDLSNVAQTAPGAVMNTQKSAVGGAGNFSTYGLPATSNLFTLDGMDQNDPIFNTNIAGPTGLMLGLNEVQEATVVNNGYSAQYGRFAGANVNYVTKSGSNEFHGDAVYWWNGRVLDANDWFNKYVPPGSPVTPRPFENANQYAASLGGPIRRNRSFFFIDYEGLRLVLPLNFGTLALIPSPHFETATLANLASTGHGASIPFYQQMFNLWNSAPGAERAVPGVPQTGDLTGCNGFTGPDGLGSTTPCALSFRSTAGNFTHEYLLGGRFDFNIGEKDKLFVRLRENQGVVAAYTDKINPIFNLQSDQPIYQGQISETHVSNSRMVNLMILSAKYVSAISQQANPATALATFPMTLSFGDGTFTGLGGEDAFVPFGQNFTSYQMLDDFTFNTGNHNLEFGMNFNRTDISDHNYASLLTGLLTPFTLADFFAGGNGPTGDSLMQNFPTQRVKPFALYGLGFYGQDDWRLRRNLHVTLSLRVDHNSNPVCQRNCFARLPRPFNELNHDVNIPYNQAIVTGLHQAWRHFAGVVWQPRIGFAWSPFGLKSTVLSGGVGLFMDTLPGAIADFLSSNSPLLNSFTVFGDNLAPTEPSNLFKDAANSNTAFLAGFSNNGTLASITASNPLFTPPNLTNTVDTKAPRYQEWNFRVQQGFGTNTSVSFNYVGNHGIFIPVFLTGVNAYCPPSACPGGFVGLPAAAPDPRFSAVTEIHSAGVSNYNGLVVSFQRRFEKGFLLQANYTWSHALDEVSNGGFLTFNGGSGGSVLNPQDSNNVRKYNYGNADYDTRRYFSASYLQELHYRHGPALLLKGWQVAGTIFIRSGFPYTVFDSVATNLLSAFGYGANGFGFGSPVYANFLGTSYPGCSSPRRACLDESQFSSPVARMPATFGAQRRNQFYGPGFFDTDLALIKETKIRGWEGARLGVGALFFNLFNHPNFDGPNVDIGTPSNFGRITETVTTPTSILGAVLGGSTAPRLIQFTARITF
jgi:carboxypeptidase family protein/TonB-dependent receptor-like protein